MNHTYEIEVEQGERTILKQAKTLAEAKAYVLSFREDSTVSQALIIDVLTNNVVFRLKDN
jgi:hypothetical protein